MTTAKIIQGTRTQLAGAAAAMNSLANVTYVTLGTITLPDQARDMFVYINPASTLLALTIVLPNDASTVIGQNIRVFFTQAITGLTFTNINPLPVSAAITTGFTLQKVAANSWVRL
jgi:hypothetical protein